MHIRPCLFVAFAVSLLLAACAGPGPQVAATSPAGGAAPAAAAPPAPPAPLAAEQRWLGALFAGTPVSVAGDADGSVRVEVPMQYAFAPDGSVPRPPLQALLARMALSLQRQPAARLTVSAPGPSAQQRLAAVRQRLQALGVAGYRVAAGAAGAGADSVGLRMALAPVPIGRLDDARH